MYRVALMSSRVGPNDKSSNEMSYISSSSNNSSSESIIPSRCAPPPTTLKSCGSLGDSSGSLQPPNSLASSYRAPPPLLAQRGSDDQVPTLPNEDALRTENAELRSRLLLAEQILNDMQRFFGTSSSDLTATSSKQMIVSPEQKPRSENTMGSPSYTPVRTSRHVMIESGGSPTDHSGTTASSSILHGSSIDTDPTPIRSNFSGQNFDLNKAPLAPTLFEVDEEDEEEEKTAEKKDDQRLGIDPSRGFEYLRTKTFQSTISLGETTIATIDTMSSKKPVMIVGNLPPVHARYGKEGPKVGRPPLPPPTAAVKATVTPIHEEEVDDDELPRRIQRAVKGLPHEYEILERHNERKTRRASVEDDDNLAALEAEEEEDVTVYTKGTTMMNPTEFVNNVNIRDSYGERGMYTGHLCRRRFLPHGFGMMRYKSFSRVYEGEWWQGSWHGQGILKNGDGTVYQGNFENDLRVGMGKLTLFDGREFTGMFMNDKMKEGTMIYADGAKYEGRLENDQRNGFGTYTYPVDDHDDNASVPNTICKSSMAIRYEGQWLDDTIHGRGQMEWADGSFYTGEWHDGFPHGMGKEEYADGTIRHLGQWDLGKPVRV